MRKILVGLATATTSAVLVLGGSAAGAPAGSPTRSHRGVVATTAVRLAAPDAPLEVTVVPPTGPFVVETIEATFTDSGRPTPARGAVSAAASRDIVTGVYYPVRSEISPDEPHSRPAVGPFPVIFFAHGFAIDAAAYAPLLRDVAAAGYVVVAPDFPGTSTRYPGVPNRADLAQQPGDISFLISSLLDLSQQPGPMFHMLDANAIGVAGQSDGGVTAAAASLNASHRDPRINASVILTGGAFGFDGQWFPPETPPVLFVHATADEVNPYAASVSMFSRAQSPKYLLTIPGGSHLGVYVDAPWEPPVATAMTAFFDLELKHAAAAADRLTSIVKESGASLDAG